MLLTCIDPRVPLPAIEYMKRRRLIGKYSQFTIAGAAIGVVAPIFKDWEKTFWENLAASIQLHKVGKIIVINHRDCGAARMAYGADKVASRQAETQTHKATLVEFRKRIKDHHPKLKTELCLMDLDGKVETFD